MSANDNSKLTTMYEDALHDQNALCDQLEAIADSLPDHFDRQACLWMAQSICVVVERNHKFEEHVVFPKLEQAWRQVPDMERTLERLRFEHCADDSYAGELRDALMPYGRGRPEVPPSTIGYMLRGFFEGLRRHIAFEREIVLPLLRLID